MSWVLIRWKPVDGDSRMPRFRNMYDIMTMVQWLNVPTMKRNQWELVTITDTEDEAIALLNLMPKYNDDIQTS
jgi:hypothetical protein